MMSRPMCLNEGLRLETLCSLALPDTASSVHAVLGSGTFVVRDTGLDPRFADNPLVAGEPYIRVYAGCPLRVSNACVLGTHCIIDSKPRQRDDETLQRFEDQVPLLDDLLKRADHLMYRQKMAKRSVKN